MNVTLHFVPERETKGAVRFKEVNADGTDVFDAKIGTLYIRKSAMGGKIPQRVAVAITAE